MSTSICQISICSKVNGWTESKNSINLRDAADQSYAGTVSQEAENEEVIKMDQSVNYLLDNLCSSEKDPTMNCID